MKTSLRIREELQNSAVAPGGLCRRATISVAALTLALSLAGCGSSRPIKYYQLSYRTSTPASQEPINTTLLVRTFEGSRLYREDRIVYGWDAQQMGTYEDHRWAVAPVEMLQSALVRGLRSSGRYQAVMSVRSDSGGDYVLAGHLYDFQEVDGGAIVARLTFEVRLRNRATGATVWRYNYNHDEPASSKDISAVVDAMDKNVERSVQEVQAGLEQYFRAHPPK
jgi:ABC-type uncharacterized transport system auxiliary subunit